MMMLKIDVVLAQREVRDRVNPNNPSLALTVTHSSIDNGHRKIQGLNPFKGQVNYANIFNHKGGLVKSLAEAIDNKLRKSDTGGHLSKLAREELNSSGIKSG